MSLANNSAPTYIYRLKKETYLHNPNPILFLFWQDISERGLENESPELTYFEIIPAHTFMQYCKYGRMKQVHMPYCFNGQSVSLFKLYILLGQ